MQTRRQFVGHATLGIAMMLQSIDSEAKGTAAERRILIGTSSPNEFTGSGEGIFSASFHDGQVGAPTLVAKASSPSFLAVPQAGHPLYAVLGGDGGESVAQSYLIAGSNAASTVLQPVGRAGSGSGGGCHVSTSKDGSCVFLANYGGSGVASFKADPTGHIALASAISFPPDEHGPVTDRQEKSHVHSALVSPDGNYVLVNDLGLDRIHVFRLDHATAKLEAHTPDHWKSEAGSGPRHLVMHPNGRWIYCICELNSTVVLLEWDAAKGTLTTKSVSHTLPDGVDFHKARGCELAFSKDLRFLYASNRRASESFAVFAVNAKTGMLSRVQVKENTGLEARYITLDPSGRWLVVANQFSGDVSVFPLDTATGKIGDRASTVKVSGASCILFV
jgi:6-phosphogluconolactonase